MILFEIQRFKGHFLNELVASLNDDNKKHACVFFNTRD